MIIIPIEWLYNWEYTLFSDKPTYNWGYNPLTKWVVRHQVWNVHNLNWRSRQSHMPIPPVHHCPPTHPTHPSSSKWQFRPRSFHHTQIEPSVISRFQKSSVRHSRKGPHAEHQWPNPSTDQGWPEITSVDPILGNSWEISWGKTACLVDLGKFPENHDQHTLWETNIAIENDHL